MELWKPITEYQSHILSGDYEVSNWGNVRNAKTNKNRALSDMRGYYKINLNDVNGKKVSIKIHRLVALYFLPKIKNYEQMEVNHIDGNKRNNSFSNLEWVTHEENILAYQEEKRAEERFQYLRLKQQSFDFGESYNE